MMNWRGKDRQKLGNTRIPAGKMVLTMGGICIRRFGSETRREREDVSRVAERDSSPATHRA